MNAKVCANCGAVLYQQWFDWDRRGYDCNYCHALTGTEGQLLEGPTARPKARSFDPRGLFVIGFGVFLAIVWYVTLNP